ncbi:MAG: alpha/beta hydrolase [Alphaproteobacteria bacterium]|jgi:pimeloyl-ACP methyl ester carboxylesterase|nr:alpha/beta hydrolase [Alphaproteobacteria bacterium]
MKQEHPYVERVVHAEDDVALAYRVYGADRTERTPLLCLTGLTRNARDFDPIGRRHGAERRVLCLDWRGRGKSGYDPNYQNYAPPTYVRDVMALLAAENVHRVVILGTSLGGLVAMGLAAAVPALIAGIVLNDIGPVVSEDGRRRIAGYVGRDTRFPDLASAAAALRQQFGGAYPDLSPEGWMTQAENTFTRDEAAGNWRLDYDLKLGDAVREQATGTVPDLWPLFGALKPIPTLVIHGKLSDVLDQPTVERMRREKPDLQLCTVPNRGHVPLLDEPECVGALDDFLKRF